MSVLQQVAAASPSVPRPAPTPAKRPEPIVEVAVEESTPWRVILFNDDVHSFDEVIAQLVKALRCSTSHASALAHEAHTVGRAIVFEGDIEECLRVEGVLKEIGLITEIQG